jgi:hypothetical protein
MEATLAESFAERQAQRLADYSEGFEAAKKAFPFTADELLGCLSRWRERIPKPVASTLELIEQWRRQS